MTGFEVRKAGGGDVLGSARYDGQTWSYTGGGEKMVAPKLAQGWTPAAVLAFYDGWSNGHVVTTATR